MPPLLVFTLRFEHRAALERAFPLVQDAADVESCQVEPGELRIRFLAEQKTAAPLLTRVYDHGGLVWCERHRLREGSG